MSQELAKPFTDKIASEFPDVKYAVAKHIAHGWDNDIIILDDKFVFRFPKNEEYIKKFKIEVSLIDYLKNKVAIAVPDYKYLAKDKSFGGYPLISGELLKLELLKGLTPVIKEQLAIDLANFLTVIHQVPKDVIKKLQILPGAWNRSHVDKMYGEIKEKIYPILSEEEIKWLEYQFKHYFSLKGEVRMSLIHNDLNNGNILFNANAGKISGILDFADAEYNDSALDFSPLFDYGEDFARSVISHYQGFKDEDLIQRAKFRRLVGMLENMLEIKEGRDLPTTYQEQRSYLHEKMRLFPIA